MVEVVTMSIVTNRRRTNYSNAFANDGQKFIDLIESKMTSDDETVSTVIIAGANQFGGDFDTNDKDLVYLANNLVASYGNEPMRYTGRIGWTKVCLQFVETGTKYKLKMQELAEKLKITGSDRYDAGSTVNNYAEDPQTIGHSIDNTGKLDYITNQTYDSNIKGKLEGTEEYYASLRVSQVKNYVKDFKPIFGALCYYPSENLAYSDGDVEV